MVCLGKAAVSFCMAVAIARGRWVIAEGGAVRDDAAACTATAASFHESGPWADVCEWYPEATLLGGGYDRVPRIRCSTGRYARVGCGGPQQRGEGPALLRTRSIDRKSVQDNDCAPDGQRNDDREPVRGSDWRPIYWTGPRRSRHA